MPEPKKLERKAHGRTKQAQKAARFAAAAVLAAGLMLTTSKPAMADSIELIAGNKNTTLDIKASAPLTDRLGVFIRSRPSVDYKGAISSFALADLTINLKGGLDAVAEVQAFGGKAVPRTGMQYFVAKGNFSLFALGAVGLDSSPYLESLTSLKFTPIIYKFLRLLAQAENISDVGSAGHVFSTQRLRFGLEWNGWGAGAATDLTESGNGGTFGWNAGGFVSKRF